ncbi:MAG: Verru_Chthon cassette protein B [Verrucomicrobiota bacterium]|nr:Verru_Chthon cassette protein B [Verrucomicrobiota bacterium]
MNRPLRATPLAFSLVEVVLAVGIVAFAFVGILGLLPTGLNVFRTALNTSVTSQIAQKVINDSMQTDFDILTDRPKTGSHPQNFTFIAPRVEAPEFRYFDDQGNELPKERKADAIYHVLVRITPGTRLPSSESREEGVSDELATVTIQVAENPGSRELQIVSGDPSDSGSVRRNLWTKTTGVAMQTFAAIVARNSIKVHTDP